MIIRYFLVTLGLFLGLTACSGGKDEPTGDDDDAVDGDDDDDDDDDDDVPTGETGDTGSQYFDAYYFLTDATFTFDSTTGAMVTATSPYGEIVSNIGLYYGLPSWEALGFDFASQEAYCYIALPLTATAPASWVSSTSMWYGVDYLTTDAPATNCNTPGYELDPAVWDTPENFLAGWAGAGWGVGIGPVKEEYMADYVGTEFETIILGAYMNNVSLPAPEGTEGYLARAFQVNASYELQIDGDGYLLDIQAADVNLGDRIATGYYRVFSQYIWFFE